MLLSGDTEDDLTIRNSMRTLAIGDAVIEAAEADPLVWAWLHALLDQMVTDPDDREMLQLSLLKPPRPKLVK